MTCVLRIDHDDDLTNRYAQAFRLKFVFRDFGREFPSHTLIEAVNSDANQHNVKRILKQNSVAYISGAGHGTYDTFEGCSRGAIWDATQNFHFLKDKIIHLLSCRTGAILGRAMVEHGATAFWGYTVRFMFRHSDHMTPLENDTLAELFLKMDSIIDRGVLAGKNGMEIYDSINKYIAQILVYLKDPVDRGLVFSNYVHIACPAIRWGDETAIVP